MRIRRFCAIAAGAAVAAAAMVGFAVPAQADSAGADLEVYTYCGGALPGLPPQLSVIIRNIGDAPAQNVTVDYWTPFGPSGSRSESVVAPGQIINYPIGTARTLELVTARVRSATPDVNVGNNVVVDPMFCTASF